jgi:hypothetical protein
MNEVTITVLNTVLDLAAATKIANDETKRVGQYYTAIPKYLNGVRSGFLVTNRFDPRTKI